MSNIQTLSDADWRDCVGDKPALLLITNGDGLRGDFSTQFKKSAAQSRQVLFGQINPEQNEVVAETFSVKDKPVLIGYLNGKTLVRRVRPWGTDVVLAVELLEDKYTEERAAMAKNELINENTDDAAEASAVAATEGNKPVAVTDADFQEQVIDFSKEMPVLVDFWAEWCGPCKMVAPIMETLAADYAGQIRVAKVDTDANQSLSQAFQVMSIPTIQVWKDGELVFSQPGAFPEPAFRQLIDQVIALDVQAALAEAQAQQEADAAGNE